VINNTHFKNIISSVTHRFSLEESSFSVNFNELTLEVSRDIVFDVCKFLKQDKVCNFDQLIDLCGVDYLGYGVSEWRVDDPSSSGFSRGVSSFANSDDGNDYFGRFAVFYNLLSTDNNTRIRVKVYLPVDLSIFSVTSIWSCADWYEREAYDMFGFNFLGHPDLRRLLTDYGFCGHPMRKDFPLSGNVEVRYDTKRGHIVYQPVTIKERVTVPKVIHTKNFYSN